jgi:hypothetical protein
MPNESAATQTADPDSIAASILKRIGMARRTPEAEEDFEEEPRNGRIPYDRFAREVARRKAAEEKLAEVQPMVEQLRTGYDAKIQALQTAAAEQVKGLAGTHAEDLALVDHGFRDPLARKAARDAFEAAPKETRGKSVQEWWAAQHAAQLAHLADPEKAPAPSVPRTLAGFLPTEAPKAAPETRPAAPQLPGGPPPLDRGTGPAQRGPAWNGFDPSKSADPMGDFFRELKRTG